MTNQAIEENDPQKTDGRVERTARTRRNILTAARELILLGVIDPTAKEVADKAGITTRTLFRHFSDMAMLHSALIEDAEAGAAETMDEPFPESLANDWRALLLHMIDRRVRVYESLLPIYVSPIWTRYRIATSGSTRPPGIRRRRERLKRVLPTEMAGDALLFEALDGVMGIEYWVSLRRSQKLSADRAKLVVLGVVESLTGQH